MLGDNLPTGIATGSPGSLCATPVVQAVAALSSFVMPAGDYVIYAVGANTRLEFQDAGAAWNQVYAVGVGGYVSSDGTNFRMANAAGVQQSFTYSKLG